MEKNNRTIVEDITLFGIGASPGIAIGASYVLDRKRIKPVERKISASEVSEEIKAFRDAVRVSKKQLEDVKQGVADRRLAEHLHIIDTHLLILEDQLLVDDSIALIESDLINAEWALKRTLDKFRIVFDAIEDEYLRDRRSDIDSVGERLLRNLIGADQQSLAELERKSIVVAHDLSPADTMQMDKKRVIGFITDVGGRTAHTAILARSLGIPAVVGLESATALVREGMPVIIDGTSGIVILNPSQATFKEYLEKKQLYEYLEQELLSYRELAAETLDGHSITLRGNVELAEEVDLALREGAKGVGLYRTEFLFMNRERIPDEEEQYLAYREVVERMAPHPVTIRTLDVGGDKLVTDIDLSDEANPALGLRAIRFSLQEGKLFNTQLRAILRASAHGQVRILFPMITGLAEIRSCKNLLEEVKAELAAEGYAFDADIQIGIMIETPSAVLIAELLAQEVDFLSVGTNDLIQYCLAIDRGNEHVAYLYEPLHPAVLRALQMVCRAGQSAGIEVGICGEMAAEPLYALVLLGLGFDELSMNAPYLPRVKRIIRQARRSEALELVTELLQFGTAPEVASCLQKEMQQRFPGIFPVQQIRKAVTDS
ncbi:phosphoenolpyruvate--protein phosphotransferase [Syntrophotalea acetylenivorans]|uniref:phosphoenolpyruvate--protein phosphotransferase n=1 Tax=Syntrophotalea acetylenivorans TaxID=1842532 RepID=UPI000A94E0B6|nr:phosphoenolpyruvate--protein phosphotransferase [Syntrophotalea acetylenivorans]